MNNLGLLLKAYMRTSFGFNKARYTHEKRTKSTGMTILMVFCYAVVIFAVFGICVGLMSSLAPLHTEYMVLNLMMVAASVMVLFTTIYKVNGTLFGFRDYDLQMSLPIRTGTLIASRILVLYILNALFVLAVMVPAGVAYAIIAQPAALFYPFFILTFLAIPLLPIIIATVIGTLIAVAASRVKRKSGLSVVLTVAAFMVFMIVWMTFWTNSGDIMLDFADVGDMVNGVVTSVYPLAALYGNAVGSYDVLSLLLFLLISFGAFAVFTAVVAKLFKRLNTSITTTRAAGDYKMTELRTQSPKKALYQRELKRYFSSSQYVLNTAVGPLLLVVVAIILLVSGVDGLGTYADIPGFDYFLTVNAPLAIAFFLALGSTTAVSVSLEGKNLWIVRSLPVDTRLVLKAKLNVSLVLYIPTIAVCGTLFNLALSPQPLYAVMTYALPLAYGLFIALFGLKANLDSPNFDWTNEVTVIKQSKPTLLTLLVGVVLVAVPAIFAAMAGPFVIVIAFAAVTALDILLYRSLMTKGAAQFERF